MIDEIAKFVVQNSYLQAASILVPLLISVISIALYLVPQSTRLYREIIRQGLSRYIIGRKKLIYKDAIISYKYPSFYISMIINQIILILSYIFISILYVAMIFVVLDPFSIIFLGKKPTEWFVYILAGGVFVMTFRLLSLFIFLGQHSDAVIELSRRNRVRRKT